MQLSIIIPTYNERDNVRLLADRIRTVLDGTVYSYEIVFVDDSRDDTPLILAELAAARPEVRYIHRDCGRGLATAVAEGFAAAAGDRLIVMDGDLQHPPELIPAIADSLERHDLALPSRFISGGSDGGLNPLRKCVSLAARTLGRLFIRRLRGVSDCTGGFFGLRRDVIREAALDPVGWKILMEVLVKGRYASLEELPYAFHARDAGESKMSLREQWNYLRHIARLLRSSPEDRRFLLFCAVGLSGAAVNLLALLFLTEAFGWHGAAASVAASLLAMLSNYVWNSRLTWRDQRRRGGRTARLRRFALVSLGGVWITALFAQLCLRAGLHIAAGQTAGIAAATLWNYRLNDRWTWGRAPELASPPAKEVGRLGG